jgi:TetR/AcrR family transcriptional regulator
MKQLKHTSTEEKIMEAAKEVFMKYGLYGARMQDIADTAGMNKALVHYYFRSKEKLFDTVFEGALTKYFQQMEIFSETQLPLEERIYTYIDNIIDFLSEYPQMSMFIIKEVSLDPELFYEKVKELKKDKGSRLIALLQEGIANQEIPDFDPFMFLVNLHSLCSYPFLASPLFRHIMKSNCTDENHPWEDTDNSKLKASVKRFVYNTFHQTHLK